MNPKKIFLSLLILFCQLFLASNSFAQRSNPTSNKDSLTAIRKYKSSKRYIDSVAKERQQKINELRAKRQQDLDSIKAERKRVLDSTLAIRNQITEITRARLKSKSDSLEKIRKYRESKKFKDSVAHIRQERIDSIRNYRTKYFDSVKKARRHVLDSTINVRKKITDSVRLKQKFRTDSLARIRKYKESRRYRDSVQVTRQSRLDSIKAVRKIYNDNILSKRKKTLDSLTEYRKARLDSLTAARKMKADSLQKERDLRAEALAKKKELREKQLKADQKKKEEKLKMQFELKMKKKHEAWSNEKMLKKKWGFVRRSFQNMFTRYNYYYNARRKMNEANKNMQRIKKDNFEKLIDLFPFDPNKDSTVFASDMDTIIRKASVGLQIHDPRTKWADDLYLLMGESYYFKGDYENAEATFKYIIGMNKALKLKNKKKKNINDNALVKKESSRFKKIFQHQPAQNDAILWLTRTDADNHKESEAEAILDLIDAETKLSDNMKAKLSLERANLLIKTNDYKTASKYLSTVVPSKAIDKYTRQRAAFLNGQLQYELGQYDSAAKSFKKSIALHPPIEMDFYARKYTAEAIALTDTDPTKTLNSLKKLLKDAKYAPYHEQVYFVLGKLSANDGKIEDAIDYYQQSLRQTKTTPKQKAISFASMGNLQYKKGQFNNAKKSYDSASYFAKFAQNNAELAIALRRGKSLSKIEEPYHTLELNDSLLKLSKLNEKEQKAVVKRYLKILEKQKDDSLANLAQNASAGSLANAKTTNNNGPSNWYFGSTVAVQQGYNEFKRKWGNRPLNDNWRRASASSFGASQIANNVDLNDTASEISNETTEKSLLAAIPKTDIEITKLHQNIKRAYVDLAAAYIKDLEEYREGENAIDSLETRYTNHEYKDEVLYLQYTAALRQSKLETAETIRQKLLTTFPNSSFAAKLNTTIEANLDNSKIENVSSYYETTYQLLQSQAYKEVIGKVNVAKLTYGDKNYSRKFRVIEAQAYAAIGNYQKADSIVNDYVKEYPSDSLRPWIDAIRANTSAQKAADTLSKNSITTNATINNVDTSIISKNIATSTNTATTALPKNYIFEPNQPHYCIFVFGKADAKVSGFRSGLIDFAKVKFSGVSLSCEIDVLNPDESMVITKGFGNAGQCKIFMNTAKNENLLFREMKADSYKYFIISEQNYLKLKAEKAKENYLIFYRRHYK